MDALETRWKTLGRSIVHQGRVTLVDHEVLLPDGARSQFEVDESVPYSVATLIIDGTDLLLSRQYRYPLDRWIYDLPGGGGRVDEAPISAAMRELEEELGVVPDDVRHLHTFFMNPGRASWPTHIFISTGVISAGRADTSDPAEQVKLVRMSLAKLDGLIREGGIVDPPLIVARAVAAAKGELPALGSTQAR